jgi:hypothetical protein
MSKLHLSLLTVATLLAPIGFADRAHAQTITSFTAPTSYSAPGAKITFKLSFNSGNFVVESVRIASAIGASYSCSGWASAAETDDASSPAAAVFPVAARRESGP